MRAPVFALAAVCAAATASLVIIYTKKPAPIQPVVTQMIPATEKAVSPVDPVNVTSKPVEQAVLQPAKPVSYSKCNVAFIRPKFTQTAVLTGTADTVIRFSQGTEIKVEASDFVNERTGQPVAGPVKLQVSEYYNMEDILLHDLSTATKDGLLETNGMINVQAFATNGDVCKLKKDGTMEIHFPKKNDKPGMALFTGVKKEDGTIIWQPLLINASVVTATSLQTTAPATVPAKKTVIDTNLNAVPEFSGGLKGIEKNINSIKNPFPVKNLNALVIADFNVDTEGYVCWVGKVAGNDEEYYNVLSEALYKMPEWKPALEKGREKIMTMRLTVSFQVTNPRLMRFWSCVKSPAQNVIRNYNRRGDGFSYWNGYEGSPENYTSGTLNYYTFTTSNLGWINCDRFYNSPAPKIEWYVAEPVEENTSIKLIFHSIKSVLNATVSNGKYCFTNVPAGEAVTVVALKGEKNNLQMAVQSTNISHKMISKLTFKSVTPDDVRNTMEQFNKLPGAIAGN